MNAHSVKNSPKGVTFLFCHFIFKSLTMQKFDLRKFLYEPHQWDTPLMRWTLFVLFNNATPEDREEIKAFLQLTEWLKSFEFLDKWMKFMLESEVPSCKIIRVLSLFIEADRKSILETTSHVLLIQGHIFSSNIKSDVKYDILKFFLDERPGFVRVDHLYEGNMKSILLNEDNACMDLLIERLNLEMWTDFWCRCFHVPDLTTSNRTWLIEKYASCHPTFKEQLEGVCHLGAQHCETVIRHEKAAVLLYLLYVSKECTIDVILEQKLHLLAASLDKGQLLRMMYEAIHIDELEMRYAQITALDHNHGALATQLCQVFTIEYGEDHIKALKRAVKEKRLSSIDSIAACYRDQVGNYFLQNDEQKLHRWFQKEDPSLLPIIAKFVTLDRDQVERLFFSVKVTKKEWLNSFFDTFGHYVDAHLLEKAALQEDKVYYLAYKLRPFELPTRITCLEEMYDPEFFTSEEKYAMFQKAIQNEDIVMLSWLLHLVRNTVDAVKLAIRLTIKNAELAFKFNDAGIRSWEEELVLRNRVHRLGHKILATKIGPHLSASYPKDTEGLYNYAIRDRKWKLLDTLLQHVADFPDDLIVNMLCSDGTVTRAFKIFVKHRTLTADQKLEIWNFFLDGLAKGNKCNPFFLHIFKDDENLPDPDHIFLKFVIRKQDTELLEWAFEHVCLPSQDESSQLFTDSCPEAFRDLVISKLPKRENDALMSFEEHVNAFVKQLLSGEIEMVEGILDNHKYKIDDLLFNIHQCHEKPPSLERQLQLATHFNLLRSCFTPVKKNDRKCSNLKERIDMLTQQLLDGTLKPKKQFASHEEVMEFERTFSHVRYSLTTYLNQQETPVKNLEHAMLLTLFMSSFFTE